MCQQSNWTLKSQLSNCGRAACSVGCTEERSSVEEDKFVHRISYNRRSQSAERMSLTEAGATLEEVFSDAMELEFADMLLERR
jgi:hypothetical protein